MQEKAEKFRKFHGKVIKTIVAAAVERPGLG
jgi:hypothetical protein